MGLQVSICEFCKHRIADSVTCQAFPAGIPPEVYNGTIDHRLPYAGDNGLQFEAVEGAERSFFYMSEDELAGAREQGRKRIASAAKK